MVYTQEERIEFAKLEHQQKMEREMLRHKNAMEELSIQYSEGEYSKEDEKMDKILANEDTPDEVKYD